jgi:hypothetical protein
MLRSVVPVGVLRLLLCVVIDMVIMHLAYIHVYIGLHIVLILVVIVLHFRHFN